MATVEQGPEGFYVEANDATEYTVHANVKGRTWATREAAERDLAALISQAANANDRSLLDPYDGPITGSNRDLS